MGDENRPVTRYQFNLWREPWEDRVRALEQRLEGHLEDHERDERDEAVEVRERRRWSWPEIVVAGITAAGVVAAAAVQAFAHR